MTCWLYTPASLPPPPPKAFCTLVSTLAPGDAAVCTPLFEHHSLAPGLRRGIPLGSHVCIHLNASLLPTPFLDRTETLSFLAVQNRGGLGASQYFHSFSDMGRQEPLSAISLSSHPPPLDFPDQLLAYENWPDAPSLLIDANPTAPNTDDLYLSLWCQEEEAHASPDHGITVCNQHADSAYPVHGASFAPTDYHRGPINRGTNFKQEYGPETCLTAAHQILRHLYKRPGSHLWNFARA